jgi:hypothetical protein
MGIWTPQINLPIRKKPGLVLVVIRDSEFAMDTMGLDNLADRDEFSLFKAIQ